ncbi:MAG: hybrid sensor histidine kinase/response regulator, partial [Cyanobacteria bacterium P01_D01_bin.2]
MTFDPASSQQVPSYFLQEASELLQQIDNELQTLRQEFSVQKVHTLMRIAHTLKGAAASVGLDAIKTTTHSLEDVFRALCAPDASLTSEVEGLIFEAYACLQLLLSARFADTQVDEAGILDRMAGIVAQLQENLGDQFGQDGYLPTSTELGFDMTQSIFEMGVTQRLADLESALQNPQPDTLVSLLQAHADVFFGLAESLNLPGFGEIAQATLLALKHHPDQVVQIAQIALEDYRSGQAQVLQGDRTQGGEPSLQLKQLSAKSVSKKGAKTASSATTGGWLQQIWQLLTRPIPRTPPLIGSAASPHAKRHPEHLAAAETAVSIQPQPTLLEPVPVAIPAAAPTPEIPASQLENTSLAAPEPLVEPPPTPDREVTLRVPVSHLEQLNYVIGELLTQQNQQALYHERLTGALKSLSGRFGQQQQQLYEIQKQATRESEAATVSAYHRDLSQRQFDSLELDQYSELQLLAQAPLDNMVQQMESAEAIELFADRSYQTLRKQQRLVDNLRNTLFEVRMQPLGSILHRFHQLLARLAAQHSKPVILKIRGDDVLVDKVIADKLYDPLLHLVRNAFDHGIETPEERQKQGKQGDGIIRLYASQSGRYLTIKVRDNGRGLDLATICQKAVESRLITPEEATTLAPEEIGDLIFEPGFSTTAQASDLSGRGIGLDAVRSQIHALQGNVTVTHQLGRGTYFTLQIPTNLTIAKLLICRAANKQYAIMTDTIRQIVIPTPAQLSTQNQVKLLSWQFKGKERLVPVISLSETLSYQGILPKKPWENTYTSLQRALTTPLNPIILTRHENQVVGLEVDQLQGEQELVIRPLGNLATTPAYVYGCSSLPDGSLSLVLDGTALVKNSLGDFFQGVAGIQNENENDSDDELLDFNEPPPPLSAPPQLSVLIVDDSITVRNTLATTLQKAGYAVIQAKEGAEALQR